LAPEFLFTAHQKAVFALICAQELLHGEFTTGKQGD
jgi:hypothetical protein